ncbi:MAG: hypothetical protein ACOYWZ_00130 [Bacillota bacterium]
MSSEEVGKKRFSPRRRHEKIVAELKAYVENPENYKSGSKSLSEIARELTYSSSVISTNLKIMYYKGELDKRIILTEKPRMLSVFMRERI